MSNDAFDLIVIGAGQAGYPVAARMGDAGRRVLLIERALVGGTCVNYGCTPTKALLASAHAAEAARRAAELGVRTGKVSVDFPAVMARKDDIVQQWREGVSRRLEQVEDRVTLLRGHASFAGERQIHVDGDFYAAPTIVVNVGGRARIPEIDGIEEVPYLDNSSILELGQLPAHLVVLGGGYVGCEFGQMFRRFGSRVTIIQHSDQLMDREDADVAHPLQEAFEEDGIELRLGARATAVSGAAGGGIQVALSTGEDVGGSHLLIASGRRPNTDDLACEAGGVERDNDGYIRVDEFYRTTSPGVYAVGDAIPGPQFTHTSWEDHRILYEILNGDEEQRPRSERIVPYTTFTEPQLARVGISQREADEQGVDYEVAVKPFREVARAVETNRTAGLIKVLIDPNDERILGAAICGAEAGELIHSFVVLMRAGAPARALADVQHIHPTFAEGVRSTVMQLSPYAL